MKVVFRTDASVQVGTGHVMRCLTLADELTRQGHDCRFICRQHEGHLGELIASKGHELIMLPNLRGSETGTVGSEGNSYADWLGIPWQQDAEQTLEALAPVKADWLVVDHYALDARWEQRIAQAVDQIMVIDDLADRSHDCAVLLDQNLGRDPADYDQKVPADCIRMIGPMFALLRPEFRQVRERSLKRRENQNLRRILISLGGVDRTNVTGHVLDALAKAELPAETELDIIMGAAAPYLSEVRQQAARLPFKATVSVSVSDMAERMCLADLAIGAAGSTSWERCCLGLPAITIILADNQRLIGEALARAKAALLIEDNQTLEDLGKLITRLAESNDERVACARKAADICDGGGAERVVSALIGSSEF